MRARRPPHLGQSIEEGAQEESGHSEAHILKSYCAVRSWQIPFVPYIEARFAGRVGRIWPTAQIALMMLNVRITRTMRLTTT